jgi:hypothetical protein
MQKPCNHCCQTGFYTDYHPSVSSGGVAVKCKFCNGTGWIDDEERISVPRKCVKDEYFTDRTIFNPQV